MTVKISALQALPPFPSNQELKTLSPSTKIELLQKISNTLCHILALSNIDSHWKAYNVFVASYVRDAAISQLLSLIFSEASNEVSENSHQKLIRKQVLSLACRLSDRQGGIDLKTILDISVVYGPKNSSRVRKLIEENIQSNLTFMHELKAEAIPAFTHLLRASDLGLHGLRKATFCLNSLLQSSPSQVILSFVLDKSFVVSLAECYQIGLSTIATSYGGLHLNHADETGWDQMWMECKITIIDCFHVLLKALLQQMNNVSIIEYAFNLVFTLLDLSGTSASVSNSIPFVNLPLLVDYQQAYSLSSTLASILANHDDSRLELLESRLRSFEMDSSERIGGIKLLLRSSGSNIGASTKAKGKQKVLPQTIVDDLEVTKVMELFPDQSIEYIRCLLALPNYMGSAELVIEGILEGTVPSPETLLSQTKPSIYQRPYSPAQIFEYTKERKNLFDGDEMRVENITIGKRQAQAEDLLHDRSTMDQMKANILRRVEAFSDSEYELDDSDDGNKLRTEARQINAYGEISDDDLMIDNVGAIRIAGDGEDSDDLGDDEDETQEVTQDPETVLELAYIRDPKLFDRDAATRRSKARAELKFQTGWEDEQLEGWRIMLERNPKKDKILQKHEFSGNQPLVVGSARNQPTDILAAGRGRGGKIRARGRGSGRGVGRGNGNNEAKERAWKDKNKASRGNHNRKRGHDRKIARGDGGFGG